MEWCPFFLFVIIPGDETFCPEAERAALAAAADERSPRRNKLADDSSWAEGESDFLSPAGFRSDCTAVFTSTNKQKSNNQYGFNRLINKK